MNGVEAGRIVRLRAVDSSFGYPGDWLWEGERVGGEPGYKWRWTWPGALLQRGSDRMAWDAAMRVADRAGLVECAWLIGGPTVLSPVAAGLVVWDNDGVTEPVAVGQLLWRAMVTENA